ncbi:MAG: adenylate/guanylate cyclase domain-containing protein [Geminicoccaceae bacterium]|nr:adenylate/guanylate cyclase domain-containing protein [Geminicoccaceae bacterium]
MVMWIASPAAPRGASPWLCPEVGGLTDWLVEQGLRQSSMTEVVQGFCERLAALGLPLWRGYVSARTLHPRISAIGYIWRRGLGGERDEYEHTVIPTDAYMKSPFAHLEERDLDRMRVRLAEETPGFPLLERFKAEGASDYLARLIAYGGPTRPFRTIGFGTSWTTDAPGGFTEEQIAVLDHLMPRLGLTLGARLGHEIAVNLLDTYLGPEAGARVLQGEIRRGSLEVIPAAILYADFRGFTRIADRCERGLLIDMLNDYFDCLVPVIHGRGGQVLKFLGDGLLATFSGGDGDETRCERALDAAAEAVRCIRDLSEQRAKDGKPVMELDLALHRGDVFFGNVGSVDRLDFTVIGPAVNEASRIEALCSQHGHPLLTSQAFRDATGGSKDRLVSIGRFMLRGVRSAQSIYTLVDS